MRPPASFYKSKSILWKMLKATYRLVEAGRHWQLAIEEWMFEQGFEIVPEMHEVFVLRDKNKGIVLVFAKVVDDFLLAGYVASNEWFLSAMRTSSSIACTSPAIRVRTLCVF